MIVEKFFEKKIKRDYFFIEGKIKINSKYFIEKIHEGLEIPDNQTVLTNVKGLMTPWKYFNRDKNFLEILFKFYDLVDENLDLPAYKLRDSWGICVPNGGFTKFHNHNSGWAGVLYLNEHDQNLEFPDIKQTIRPETGKFVLFSSFLNHGCKRHRCDNYKYGISFNISGY